jgi:hypothetical protein
MCGIEDFEMEKTGSRESEELREAIVKTEDSESKETEKEDERREFDSEVPVTI